jgi:hypothetical protein
LKSLDVRLRRSKAEPAFAGMTNRGFPEALNMPQAAVLAIKTTQDLIATPSDVSESTLNTP